MSGVCLFSIKWNVPGLEQVIRVLYIIIIVLGRGLGNVVIITPETGVGNEIHTS